MKNAMKYTTCLFWLLMVTFLVTTDSRADSIALVPSAGLSRTSIYGPTYDPNTGKYDGPSGLLGVSTFPGTNGVLFNDYDSRDPEASGFISDQLLLYDLGQLSDAVVSAASLLFQVDEASVNGQTDGDANATFVTLIYGSNTSTLDFDDLTPPPAGVIGMGVPSGIYNGSRNELADMTTILTNILDQNFKYAKIFLGIDGPITATGPMSISFTTAPTLNATGSGFQPVPEASSIIQLGISMAGLGLFTLRRGVRAR